MRGASRCTAIEHDIDFVEFHAVACILLLAARLSKEPYATLGIIRQRLTQAP